MNCLRLVVFGLVTAIVPAIAGDVPPAVESAGKPAWVQQLERELLNVDRDYDGDIGVFVKDLNSGVTASLRAGEFWYLASGIKLPVAIAVMRSVEVGKLTLDTKIELRETDYVDGAGWTKWH